MEESDGYGYGIWLIPKSSCGSFIVDTYNSYPFKNHITVMCMMTKKMAQFAYMNLFNKFTDNTVKGYVNTCFQDLNDSDYGNNKENESYSAYSAGVNINIPEWENILEKLKDFKNKGSFPKTPHMSLIYSDSSINPVIIDFIKSKDLIQLGKSFEATFHLVDINDSRPWKWKILS